jgi:glutamine amidotransferase
VCELFALTSARPVDLTFSVAHLARRGGREAENLDGWGLAAYEECDVYLAREPHPASESPLLRCMEHALPPVRLLISHLRAATRGAKALCNTQPFVRVLGGRKHVFAHNGDLDEIQAAAGPYAEIWRPVGDTDSEIAFANLLNALTTLWLPDQAPSLEARLEAIEAFAAALRPLGPANFLYCDGEYLYAHAHRRTQPDGSMQPPGMYLLHGEDVGCREFQGAGVTARCPGGDATLFASVPLSDDPWTPLAEGELVVTEAGRIIHRNIPDPA